MAKKPLEIDGIFGSSIRDTQGEVLSIEGADISELEAGRGRFNDNHGKAFTSIIGRITSAKKIFKREDCEDDRQRYYWDKIKAAYIYGRGVLFNDDDEHQNAKACAAILRNIHKTDCPLKLKMSVEGGVLARGVADPSLLARTKIHSCAITFVPANQATLVEPLNLDKSNYDEVADFELIKSVMHLAETNAPSFRHIARDASASKVINNIEKIAALIGDDVSSINFPSKQDVIEYALEKKIESNISKIHEIINIELEKGFKENAIGAALMGVAALSPNAGAADQVKQQPIPAPTAEVIQQQKVQAPKQSHVSVYKQVAKKNPILGAIGLVESSGGQNLEHKTIDKPGSMHYGHTAGGIFGMMPNAAKYVLDNTPKLATKYPKLAEAAKNIKANHKAFTDTFNSNASAAVDFAEALFDRNKSKTKNMEMLVNSWNSGLKGTWNQYKAGGMNAIKSNEYVKRVLGAYEHITGKHKDLHKALMAGYGGSGAPTSRSGGSVIQSESLDTSVGNKGFKYITCPECGYEQIYSKFQVKCRQPECGKSFSMATLEKLFNSSNK